MRKDTKNGVLIGIRLAVICDVIGYWVNGRAIIQHLHVYLMIKTSIVSSILQ